MRLEMKRVKSLILLVFACIFSVIVIAFAACDAPDSGSTTDGENTVRKTSATDPIVGTWFCEDEKIAELMNPANHNYYSNCKLYYIISFDEKNESDYSLTIWTKYSSTQIEDAWSNGVHTGDFSGLTVTVKDVVDGHYGHKGRIYGTQSSLENNYHFVLSNNGKSFSIYFVNSSGTISDNVILTFTRTSMTLDEFKELNLSD